MDAITRAKGPEGWGLGCPRNPSSQGQEKGVNLHLLTEDEEPAALSSLLCLDGKWGEGLWEAVGQGSSLTLLCDLRLIATPL